MIEIYVIVDKTGKSPSKDSGWKDTRKLLVYTSKARARAAMKSRGIAEDHYEIKTYVPKGDD